MRRALRLPLALATAAAAAACDDPTELIARAPVVSDTMIVYAMSGTDFTLPAALNIPELAVVRPTGAFNYDIGFDIDDQERVVLTPMMLLASELADIHPVGLRRMPESFEDLTRAPTSGYEFEEPLVVSIDETVAVQVGAPRYCGFPYPEIIYAKLVVDSLDVESRRIYFRLTVDPSCGFRSFLPGIPRD